MPKGTSRIGWTINTAYKKNPLHLWYFYPDNFNIGFRHKTEEKTVRHLKKGHERGGGLLYYEKGKRYIKLMNYHYQISQPFSVSLNSY